MNADPSALQRRWTLLALALAGRPIAVVLGGASHRSAKDAAACIAVPPADPPEAARLAVLRQVLDRDVGGRWALDLHTLQRAGLIGPFGPGPGGPALL